MVRLPYARHHNPLLIINRSWILTVHKVRILRKKLLKNVFGLQKWVKSIQTAGYNCACTVIERSQPTKSFQTHMWNLYENIFQHYCPCQFKVQITIGVNHNMWSLLKEHSDMHNADRVVKCKHWALNRRREIYKDGYGSLEVKISAHLDPCSETCWQL